MTTDLNDIEQRAHLYIDGEWVLPDSSETIEVIDASTRAALPPRPAGDSQ